MRAAQVLVAFALLALALADFWFGKGHKALVATLGGPARPGPALPPNGAASSTSSAADTATAMQASITGPAPGGIAADVARFLGVPYLYGGSTPSGFDCSGLSSYVYADAGIKLPRTSQQQSATGIGESESDAQPGDLVFFGGGPGKATHVGVYVGGGQMIDAPHTGTKVRLENVWPGGYFERIPGAR